MQTYFATNNALTVKAWHEKLWRDIKLQSYFDKFMSTKGDSIVHELTELGKGTGDEVTVGLRLKLQGGGQESDDGEITLEGREEAMQTRDFALRLSEVGHAVRGKNPMAQQRVFFAIDDEARQSLLDWTAEKVDSDIFRALQADDPTKIFYGGTAKAKSALTATQKITPMLLSKVKAWAKSDKRLLGGTEPPIRPIRVGGKEYYVVLLHPHQMFDLKQDSTFQQWMREAEARGSENPLFTGASAMVDGLVIHEHELVKVGSDAGASNNVPYAMGHLLGAQALCYAWGKDRPTVRPKAFDYGRKVNYAVDYIRGVAKTQFKFDGTNLKDFGAVGIMTARTDLS